MSVAATYVCVNSLYHAVNKKFNKRRINYSSYLLSSYGPEDTIFSSTAYVLEFSTHNPHNFIKALNHSGFTTKIKKAEIIETEKGKLVKNKSASIEIAVDVMRVVSKVDTFIFGVNDESLSYLFDYLRDQGKTVILFSCGASKKLRNSATSAIDITENELSS